MRVHAAIASLILTACCAVGCGDSAAPDKAAPSAADAASAAGASDSSDPVGAAKEAAKEAVSGAADDVVEKAQAEATKAVSKALGDNVKGAGDGEPASSDEGSSTLGHLETVAGFLGITITDETRPLVAKVAAMVDDDATRQQVLDAAKQVGIDPDDFSTDSIKSKLLGLGGDDEEDAADDEATRARKRAARKRRKAAAAAAAAGEAVPGGTVPESMGEGTGAGDAPIASTEDLSGLDVPALKKRRDAEIADLEADRDSALAALADKFAEKKKADPAKADVFDERRAKQEEALQTAHDALVEEVRAKYRTAIKAARAK